MLHLTLLLFICLSSYGRAGKVEDTCNTCRDIVKNFNKGLEKTAKDHFGGGDTAWEESRLGSFARSETRLLEILEGACEGAAKESRCHALVEEYEEKIEEYWFNKHKELDQLEKFLCIETMNVCCPQGQYGKTCKDCPGGSQTPCNGHGKCKGSGTKEGNGECECDEAYEGDLCDECSEKYYDSNGTCLSCDESCESSCSDGTNKGCDSCKDGYMQDEEEGCIDKNECEEDDICVEGKFCINNKGSYKCQDCDPACDGGCTGSGRLSCNQCKSGWKQIEDGTGCEDVNECASEENPCSVGTYCKNTEGSHECVPCHSSCSTTDGCTGEGPARCVACAPGWEKNEADICVDVDECQANTVQCQHGEVCVNQDGPDSCQACHQTCKECFGIQANECLSCKNGYTLKNLKCDDMNECLTNPCDKTSENCNNTPGSFNCKCKKGWVRTKKGACKKKTVKKKKDKTKEKGIKEETLPQNESESTATSTEKAEL